VKAYEIVVPRPIFDRPKNGQCKLGKSQFKSLLQLPAGGLFELPNNPRRGRNGIPLVVVRPLQHFSCLIFVLGELGTHGRLDVVPLPAAVIKLADSVQLIPLVLRREASAPFAPKDAYANDFLRLHVGVLRRASTRPSGLAPNDPGQRKAKGCTMNVGFRLIIFNLSQ
jgi:hypothetical protein